MNGRSKTILTLICSIIFIGAISYSAVATFKEFSFDEPDALSHARDSLGIENVMWSSDYPHPVSSWPNSQAVVDEMFAAADPHERELVVSGNAARVWSL